MRWLIVATLLVGCHGQPSDTDDLDPIEVEVGSGIGEYLPVDDESVLALTHGPQGGWHLDVMGLLRNSPELVGVVNRVRTIDTDVELTGDHKIAYVLLADYDKAEASGTIGQRVIFGPHPYLDQHFICDLRGERIEICTEVSDPESKNSGEGCVDVEIEMDENDLRDQCRYFPR